MFLLSIKLLAAAGACYHALGYHKKAIDDYSKAFLIHEENLPEEVRQQQVRQCLSTPTISAVLQARVAVRTAASLCVLLQVLAFFQKELVQYAHSHLDEAVAAFSLDRDIHPVFKV